MKNHSFKGFTLLIPTLILTFATLNAEPAKKTQKKKTVYISYILHGNMNYDRYVRPTIWEEFPKIYDNLLTFMDEHEDFKGQLQFSGQTLGSLQQCAPEVVGHAMNVHKRGQLNFTGTFYSEPVNVNMDGETNYRCAWLGTKIVEDAVGETDGFYLQERAYHSQLPWILNHSNVSWTPAITGQEDWYPFKLIGMDGSTSVCVPITRHGKETLDRLPNAPANALLLIEEDYEIPQSFVSTYEDISKFNAEHQDIEVKWITVKEYIKKFGLKGERMVDHSAKALNLENGTYSRWTADPLDIIVQDYTNKAMADRRSAELLNAFVEDECGFRSDRPFEGSGIALVNDPLAWNIANTGLYPSVEENYLKRNGAVTLLSKAEHLLLWAVNSDSKGWYPLYEKRRERVNSFENSSLLSRSVIEGDLEKIASQAKLKGYDTYYIIANMELARTRTITVDSAVPYDFYDLETGKKLPSFTTFAGRAEVSGGNSLGNGSESGSTTILGKGRYSNEFKADLPAYGYRIVGARKAQLTAAEWKEGSSISHDGITLGWNGSRVEMSSPEGNCTIEVEGFQVKQLAMMTAGTPDDQWRAAVPYGEARVSVREGLNPQLKIERQLDWLVHLQQTFTINDGKVECESRFVFPNPTLVRQDGTGTDGRNTWDPRGLVLTARTHKAGKALYDMPYAIAECPINDLAYLCPLSSCFLQSQAGGLLVSPQTGEQAMCVRPDEGTISVYLGSSTTSGPIRNAGLHFDNPTSVSHDSSWYAEVFHGEYVHNVVFVPYSGSWKEAHIPAVIRSVSSPVYVKECGESDGSQMKSSGSFAGLDCMNVDITMAEYGSDGLKLRFNEREGEAVDFNVTTKEGTRKVSINAFGIK